MATGVLGLLLLGLPSCSEEERPAPSSSSRRPNVLLLVVDTLRADHLGSYGHALDTSPRLDDLAEKGVRFSDASVQWTKTWPSMASMLTGTYPTQTGIRYEPRRPLPERNRTLAEILREEGYATAAVVSNANLGTRFAFDQGFDHFVEAWVEEYRRRFGDREFENRPGLTKELTRARGIVDEGLAWLDARSAEDPFFLWLHFMEPHGPYLPPPEHAGRFVGGHATHRVPATSIPRYQWRKRGGRVIRDLGFYQAQYDGEVRHFDDELARLLDELEARGLLRDTLLVLTSDHGESLDEHGHFLEHGLYPFQPTAHVPLLLSAPGLLPEGRVVEKPVGLVNLVPTLLELLDLPAPEDLPEPSLAPLAQGTPGARPPPFVFVEAGVHSPSQRAVRRGPWKLVHFRAEEDRRKLRQPEWSLHHLERDPGELRNVADEHPRVVAELREALRRYDRTHAADSDEDETLELEELDAQTREQLRALGYLEPEPEGETEGEDPPEDAPAEAPPQQ